MILPNFFDSNLLISKKRINLGLDLRGGASLLLEVDLDSYIQEKLDVLVSDITDTLLKYNIKHHLENKNNHKLLLTLLNNNNGKMASELIFKIDRNLEIDNKYFISYSKHYKDSLAQKVLSESIDNIKTRLDKLGTKEVSIQKQGNNKILIQVPGISNIDEIKSLLGKTAKLTFHLIDHKVRNIQDINHTTTVLLSDSFGNSYPVLRKIEIGGYALTTAFVKSGSTGKNNIYFKFNDSASRQFERITKANIGNPFAIVLDNIVLIAPIINVPIINGEGEISGNFTAEQANELAILFRSGALPAPLNIIEEKNIGPTVGAESIKTGGLASIISIIIVSLSMVLIYGRLGLFVSIGLLFNAMLILCIFTLFGFTLTLPGISGIALTIGMSVDANILIFERIKEGIRGGKRVKRAIEEGFNDAIRTILDSNITTLIAAGIMFVIGSGAIKGFSITLSIGILCSMFTAIIVTRFLMELCNFRIQV
ncbi:protein translocase subunit SecD [Wolbachia endosymbiont of Pentidionis agamae]|uniref:protein translocase subunit SecD n=1 Tax=Wolbachia endosymbiont of Pentidionis agamae TaxID=3110435 RepID=UPI002FD17933